MQGRGALADVAMASLSALLVVAVVVRSPLLLLGAGLASVIAVASAVMGRQALRRLEFERRWESERCFAGESVGLRVVVTNRKLLPVTLLTADQPIAEALRPAGAPVGVYLSGRGNWRQFWSVGSYQRVSRLYRIECRQRGYYPLAAAELNGGDPFGLVTETAQLPAGPALIVYPKPLPLTSLGLPARRPFGDRRGGDPLFPDPTRFAGLRDYQPGDPPGRIHWKASSRAGSLQVKQLEPATDPGLAVFLNVWSYEHPWDGVDTGALERGVTAAASVLAWAVAQGWPAGLYANGHTSGWGRSLRLPPARGEQVLPRCLEGLARLTPVSDLAPALQFSSELTRLVRGTTLVVVSRAVTPPLAAALLRATAGGWPVTLLLSGEGVDVPHLRGVRVLPLREGAGLDASLA